VENKVSKLVTDKAAGEPPSPHPWELFLVLYQVEPSEIEGIERDDVTTAATSASESSFHRLYTVSVRVSIAVKGHHDHSNSHK
ncbi:hypothetical protein ACQP3F_32615, partial [Escherichia coli]